MGATGKGKNANFRYEVLFAFSYTFKSGEKYDAILHNGSGQPAAALKLRTVTQDELLEIAGTI